MARRSSQVSQPDQPMFQRHENDKALVCIVHEPGLHNLFGNLHPVGRLYERPFDLELARKEHRQFVQTMRRKGVEVVDVADILAAGCRKGEDFDMTARIGLEELAMKNLQYRLSADCDPDSLNDTERFYISDEYKRHCIEKINTNQLIQIVMTCPTVTLNRSHRDTALVSVNQSMSPVGNLIFTRDQQITTAKGIVFGNMASSQRQGEVTIMREVFTRLAVPVIGEISDPGKLEGGDFIPAGNMCFIGTGLRTNTNAVRQLMDKDLLGYDTVVEVRDVFERSQDRMHLDCVFNVVGDNLVLLMDTLMQRNSLTRRLVTVYTRQADGSHSVCQTDVEFSAFLRSSGFHIIAIPEKYQLQYGVNCLNLGESQLIMMHEESARLVAKSPHFRGAIDVIDYSNVSSMYGSLHCTSQVIRRSCTASLNRRRSRSPSPDVHPQPLSSSCSLMFICNDIALLHRNGLDDELQIEDEATREKCSGAKGRELQQLVLSELSALHLLLLSVQKDVLLVSREESHFEVAEPRPRPCALLTSHMSSGHIAFYHQCSRIASESVRFNLESHVQSFGECPIEGFSGGLDLVLEPSAQVAFVSSSFKAQRDALVGWGEQLGFSCLVMLDVRPHFQGHLSDILFVSSSLVVLCAEFFDKGSLELIDKALPKSATRVSISAEQVRMFCCSLVELPLSTQQSALLVSSSVMARFTSEQRELISRTSHRVIQCNLNVCEAIRAGSARDFVIPLQ